MCKRREKESMWKKKYILCTAAAVVAATGMLGAGFACENAREAQHTASPLKVQSMSAKEQTDEIELHYQWKGEGQPHLYYEVANSKQKTSYPGVPMTKEADGWYSYKVEEAKAAKMIISVPELQYQTSEFDRSSGEYWYDEEEGWAKNPTFDYKKASSQEVVVDDVELAEASKIVVHYPSDLSDVSIYYWNVMPKDMTIAWPGQSLKKDDDGYYSYTFSDVTKVNFLFTDNKEQTNDFTIKAAGEYWYDNGAWVDKKPSTIASDSDTKDEKDTEPTKTDEIKTTPAPGDTDVVEIDTSKVTKTDFSATRTDFRDESIYFLMTTRFYDGDPGNNSRGSHDDKVGNPSSDPSWRGDFKGVIEKLDYIKALGFTSIWITPVVENRSTSGYDYHGYHAYNFKNVDSRYCSDGVGYQDLINAAHKKGIKVIQDIVLNHSGGYGEANLQTFSSNEASTIAAEDGNGYYNHEYIKSWESYGVQTTSIDGNCLDLNTENPTVIKYLQEAYDQYINMGVDGFRIDTMKHISRLTFNKEFAPHYTATAKAKGKDNFYMFGEVCARDENALYFSHWACISAFFYTWAETEEWAWGDTSTNASSVAAHFKKYEDVGEQAARKEYNSDNAFLKGNEYHKPDTSKSSGMGVIDFPMHWSFRNANNAYNRALQDDAFYNDATWNVVYVDSHDYGPNTMEKIRYKEGTEAWAENLALMFTFRGVPCIYYGSEVEFMAGAVIDGYDMKIAETGRAYYGDNITGEVTATDFGEYTASGNVKETLSKPLCEHLITLNKIRQAVPALRKGQYSTEGCSGNMAYKRRYTDDTVDSFCCVAVSGDATFKDIPAGTYVDCVTGDKQTVAAGGTLSAKCSGKGNLRVYVLTTSKTAAPGKVGNGSTYMK